MDIFSSVLYLISFICCIAGIVCIDKSERNLNLNTELVVSTVFFMGFETAIGLFYNLFGISINLFTLTLGNILLLIIISFFIIRHKKIQKLYLDKVDLVIQVVFVIIAYLLSSHIFHGYTIGYKSGDPASHFFCAMRIVRNGDLPAMPFSPLMNAIAINICRPWLNWSEYYRGLELADTVVFLLLILLIYAILSSSAKKIKDKLVFCLICLFCILGYPLYSYIGGGFIWLTAGLLLSCLSIYCLKSYFGQKYYERYMRIVFICSMTFISWAYVLFAPFCLAILYLSMIVMSIKKGEQSIVKVAIHKATFFLIPGVFFILTFLKYWIDPDIFSRFLQLFFRHPEASTTAQSSSATVGDAISKASEAVISNGYEYSRLYSDFLFLLPVIVALLVFCIKNKEKKVFTTLVWISFIGIIVAYLACQGGYLAGYYYYKFYFLFWILCWLCVGEAYDTFKEYSFATIPYAMVFLILFITSTFQIEQRAYDHVPSVNHAEGNMPELFLYTKNSNILKEDYSSWWVSNEDMQLFSYVMEETENPMSVTMLSDVHTVDDFVTMRWYSGLCGNNSIIYCWYSARDAIMLLREQGLEQVAVLNTSGYYDANIDVFGSYPVEYRNEAGVVLNISQ